MIPIHTKRAPNGQYYCYATINGYDYSFEGETEYMARRPMLDKLNRCDGGDFVWEPTEFYALRKIEEKPIGIQPAVFRIDRGMV